MHGSLPVLDDMTFQRIEWKISIEIFRMTLHTIECCANIHWLQNMELYIESYGPCVT